MELLPTLKLGETEYTNISKPILVWLPTRDCYEFDTIEEARAEMRELAFNGEEAAHHAQYWAYERDEWRNVS